MYRCSALRIAGSHVSFCTVSRKVVLPASLTDSPKLARNCLMPCSELPTSVGTCPPTILRSQWVSQSCENDGALPVHNDTTRPIEASRRQSLVAIATWRHTMTIILSLTSI